jgi:hypothetical protein
MRSIPRERTPNCLKMLVPRSKSTLTYEEYSKFLAYTSQNFRVVGGLPPPIVLSHGAHEFGGDVADRPALLPESLGLPCLRVCRGPCPHSWRSLGRATTRSDRAERLSSRARVLCGSPPPGCSSFPARIAYPRGGLTCRFCRVSLKVCHCPSAATGFPVIIYGLDSWQWRWPPSRPGSL